MQEKMTRKEFGKEAVKGVISITATVLASLVILSFTKFDDKRESVQKELLRLDKEKVDATFVNQKCLETKQEMSIKYDNLDAILKEIKDQQRIQNEDTKEILRYLRK